MDSHPIFQKNHGQTLVTNLRKMRSCGAFLAPRHGWRKKAPQERVLVKAFTSKAAILQKKQTKFQCSTTPPDFQKIKKTIEKISKTNNFAAIFSGDYRSFAHDVSKIRLLTFLLLFLKPLFSRFPFMSLCFSRKTPSKANKKNTEGARTSKK